MSLSNKNDGSRYIFGVVIGLLALLTVVSSVLLTIRLINFIKVDNNEILLTSNLDSEFDLFSASYENESGEVSVKGADGQKVIAPGTSVEYTIRLRNTDSTAIDYELVPDIDFTAVKEIPILIRMHDADGNYIIGDEQTWVSVQNIPEVSDKKTLLKGESKEYYFIWKWDFESGNDEYDTELGIGSVDGNFGVSVSFDLHSEANTTIGANGGFVRSGLGEIIFIASAILILLASIVLLIAIPLKKKKIAE